MINAGLVPGAAAVAVLMRRLLNLDMTDTQSNILWAECRGFLEDSGKTSTISASQKSYFGALDANSEEELVSVIGLALGSERWSVNGDKNSFFDQAAPIIARRGYQKASWKISLKAG